MKPAPTPVPWDATAFSSTLCGLRKAMVFTAQSPPRTPIRGGNPRPRPLDSGSGAGMTRGPAPRPRLLRRSGTHQRPRRRAGTRLCPRHSPENSPHVILNGVKNLAAGCRRLRISAVVCSTCPSPARPFAPLRVTLSGALRVPLGGGFAPPPHSSENSTIFIFHGVGRNRHGQLL